MKKLWRQLGIICFWLSWPLLWLAFNNTERSRLMMFNDGKLLVTRSWLGDGRWGLPGGGKRKKESPLDSIIREVHEELGLELTVDRIKTLARDTVHDKGFTNIFDYFVAEEKGEVKLKPRHLEVSEAAWLAPSQLDAKNASVDVLHGLANYTKQKRDLLQ